MRLQVFSIFDKAVLAYMPPFYVRARGEALRSFSDAVNDDSKQFFKHAADFTLMFLGEWDDQAGVFSGVDPVRVISAYECLAEDPFTLEKKVESSKRVPM